MNDNPPPLVCAKNEIWDVLECGQFCEPNGWRCEFELVRRRDGASRAIRVFVPSCDAALCREMAWRNAREIGAQYLSNNRQSAGLSCATKTTCLQNAPLLWSARKKPIETNERK